MPSAQRPKLSPSAYRLLIAYAASEGLASQRMQGEAADIEILLAADLIERHADRALRISSAGRAYLARRQAEASRSDLDPFLAQHLPTAPGIAMRPDGAVAVRVDQAESPLAWLARRKGRDGTPLIAPEQLLAGERLRAEFTRAQLTPRVTADWTAAIAQGSRGARDGAANLADTAIAARQRVRNALTAVGPEFAGLLLDVCCFLKGLDDVERERRWPARSAKVVLQLGLDRLARHYGLASEARGRARGTVQTWLAPDAVFGVEEM